MTRERGKEKECVCVCERETETERERERNRVISLYYSFISKFKQLSPPPNVTQDWYSLTPAYIHTQEFLLTHSLSPIVTIKNADSKHRSL